SSGSFPFNFKSMPTFFSTGGSPVATSPERIPPPYRGEFGCGTPGWACARRQKAESRRQKTTHRQTKRLGFLLTAFCILLLLPHFQLLQRFFLRLLNGHAIALTILIGWSILQHVVPLFAQNLNFPQRTFGRGRPVGYFIRLPAALFLSALRGFLQFPSEARRALQMWLGRQPILFTQRHGRARRLDGPSREHPKDSPDQKEREDHQNSQRNDELGNRRHVHVAHFVRHINVLDVRSVRRFGGVMFLRH